MRTIILLGDIHGEYQVINKFFKKNKLSNVDIIQVGDFGVGFYHNDKRNVIKDDRELQNLSNYLGKRNSKIYVLRGNHDDPKYFDGTYTKYENIIFLVDYEPFKLNNISFLPIGGAISIDKGLNPYDTRKKIGRVKKVGRRIGINWWPDEEIVFKPEVLKKLIGIDIVLTHSGPDFALPYGVGKVATENQDNPGLVMSILEERNTLSKIFDILNENNNISHWFYGHFHKSNKITFNDVELIGLDIDEFYELKINKMNNENFIKGVSLIGRHIPDNERSDYTLLCEHDQIWFGDAEWITDDHDILILNEMGWFEDNGKWCCFI